VTWLMLPLLAAVLAAAESMQTQAKQHFREKLQGALANTSLVYSELAVDGFVMKFNREETAASDVVHACTALLTEHTVAETSKTAASGFWWVAVICGGYGGGGGIGGTERAAP